MNIIKNYIEREKISKSEFARRAKISRQLLNWHFQNPNKGWSLDNAQKVVTVIYGEIIREKVVDLILGNGDDPVDETA
jgi:hypothetical protein